MSRSHFRMKHSRSRIIIDGAIAGLLGAGVVALWFLIFDAARGRTFETPALLAAAILHGSHPDGISAIQLMMEYSVLHFGAFIIAGIIGGLPCFIASIVAWAAWGGLLSWYTTVMFRVGCPPIDCTKARP